MSYQPSSELNDLCAAAADGTLNEANGARLGEMLRDDDDARAYYVDYVEVHALLQWRHGAVEPLELPLAPSAKPKAKPRRQSYVWPAAAALACAAVAAFVFLSMTGRGLWQPGNQPPAPIAIVVNDNTEAFMDGRQLRPGRQRIASGVAHIELDNGVLLAAAGPVEFEIAAADHVHLHSGKLHVYSPLATRGFTVTTSRGVQIVDLGTRFGVWADKDDVHVHLYQGRLQVNGEQILDAGQAVTVDAQGALRPGASDEAMFPPLHRE